MKKVISLTVAFVMLLALTISAFAADTTIDTSKTGSLTMYILHHIGGLHKFWDGLQTHGGEEESSPPK